MYAWTHCVGTAVMRPISFPLELRTPTCSSAEYPAKKKNGRHDHIRRQRPFLSLKRRLGLVETRQLQETTLWDAFDHAVLSPPYCPPPKGTIPACVCPTTPSVVFLSTQIARCHSSSSGKLAHGDSPEASVAIAAVPSRRRRDLAECAFRRAATEDQRSARLKSLHKKPPGNNTTTYRSQNQEP